MKNRREVAVVASIVNVIFAALSIVLGVKIYGRFGGLEFPPDIKLEAAEKLIRLTGYQLMPAYAAVMTLSALIFWLLRKQQ